MATSRPFAYNTGSPIGGTDQVGDLAIGYPTEGFESTGLQWWNGPDEDLGYVIAKKILGGDQPNPLDIPAYVGFSRTSTLSESEFVDLANNLTGYSQNFTTGDQANIWLNANGYWTSYVGGTGPAGGFSITISEVGSNVVMTASGTLNINDLTLISSGTGPFGGGGLGISSATFVLGSMPAYFDEYTGFTTTPSNFGTGGGLGSSSSTGDIMGVIYQGAPPYHLVVPSGYTSGTYITGSQTFNTQTFNSLGLTVGTYTYTWGSGPNADSINVVVGGTGSTGSTGGATGAGWYFYAPEGPLVDGPPVADGQVIFTDNLPGGGTNVTFDPNKSGGVNFLNFNLSDVDGVDYTTQFTNLQNSGGTVSVTQNGDTATYVLTTGMAFINSGFVAINADAATQTVNASGSFVSGSPITISFS